MSALVLLFLELQAPRVYRRQETYEAAEFVYPTPPPSLLSVALTWYMRCESRDFISATEGRRIYLHEAGR
jgi:hypothetical protein